MIIAIDGPAGAGKSTTARAVAERFGFTYVDTGAMYRAVALAADERGLQPGENEDAIVSLARDLPLHFAECGTRLFLGEREVSDEIRVAAIGAAASQIASNAALREIVMELQRRLAREGERTCGGAVLEGRDIQTVVFPDAEVKIFLTADSTTRANRRAGQWSAAAPSALIDAETPNRLEESNRGSAEAERDIRERDERDMARAHSPLRAAPDAIHVSTDELSVEEVVACIAALIEAKRGVAS